MTSLRWALGAFGVGACLNLWSAWLLRSEAESVLSSWLTFVLLGFAALVLPWWAGRYLRLRDEQRRRLQVIVSDQARLRERARIAQDMHDSLGHDLAMIALGSGALEMAPDAPPAQRAAATEVRARAVAATDRLHEIIGVMRDNADPASPGTQGQSVENLVDRARRSGADVRMRRSGDDTPVRATERLVHRVVQEALTNAAKHSPGAAITINVDQSVDAVLVEVSNGAPSGIPTPDPDDAGVMNAPVARDRPGGSAGASGQGLAGLKRQLRPLGGSLNAGRRGTGYQVVALIPLAAGLSADDATPDPLTTRSVTDTRRLTRRRQWQSAAMPLVFAGVLAAVVVTLQVLTVRATALAPDKFDQIQIGQPRSEFAALLPPSSIPAEGVPVPIPASPDGSACEFYLARGHVLDVSTDFYRLCFDDGVVVSTDHLKPGDPR